MNSKLLLYMACCLLLCIPASGQLRKLESKNLDAYVGTWEYRSNNELFRIVFIKGTNISVSYISDCVTGGYCYKKDGLTIGNYTSNIPTTHGKGVETLCKIMGTNAKIKPEYINPTELDIFFYDDIKQKSTMSGTFTLLSPTQARWYLVDDEGMIVLKPGELPPPEGFSVPTDVVMTKVQ